MLAVFLLGIAVLFFFWFIPRLGRGGLRELGSFAVCLAVPAALLGGFIGDKTGLNATEWAVVTFCALPFAVVIYFVRCLFTGRL